MKAYIVKKCYYDKWCEIEEITTLGVFDDNGDAFRYIMSYGQKPLVISRDTIIPCVNVETDYENDVYTFTYRGLIVCHTYTFFIEKYELNVGQISDYERLITNENQ